MVAIVQWHDESFVVQKAGSKLSVFLRFEQERTILASHNLARARLDNRCNDPASHGPSWHLAYLRSPPAPELRNAAEELGLTASASAPRPRAGSDPRGKAVPASCEGRGSGPTKGAPWRTAANVALSDLDAVAAALNSETQKATRSTSRSVDSLTYCWLLPRLSRFVAANPNIRLSFETGIAITRFDHHWSRPRHSTRRRVLARLDG